MAEPEYISSEFLRPQKEKKPWDVFEDPPIKIVTGSMVESNIVEFLVKVLKILSYVVSFVVVLGAAGISKGTLLFMTSQIASNQTRPYCNQKIEPTAQFVVKLSRLEKTAWIWIIIFTYFVPELVTFLRSVRICLFKTWKLPTVMDFVSCFITESLPTIGSAILVFCILPEMDVVKGVMLTNAVCFVPAVVGFLSRNPAEDANYYKMMLDILSIVSQATAFIVWPIIENKPFMWLIPLSVILISCGWWENYVSENSSITFIQNLGRSKKSFDNSRYFVYIFISIWKCILFLITTIIIVSINENRVDFLFEDFVKAFEEHYIDITEIKPIATDFEISDAIATIGTRLEMSSNLTPVWVFLINIFSSYICYAFGKFACKISIQGFGYAFPVNLAVPFTILMLIFFTGKFNGDECAFADTIPPYLFFNIPPVYYLQDFLFSEHSWVWLLWLFSQAWVTIHLWSPRCEKLARTERIFMKPLFDAFLIDQSIALNRRRDDLPEKFIDDDDDDDEDDKDEDNDGDGTTSKTPLLHGENPDAITQIYACATMWHETKIEMIEFLKSIMRLDEDQGARRLVREELAIPLKNYYELETHIFFDDAFVRIDEKDNDPMVNQYVADLVSVVDDAASEVHQIRMRIKPPKKLITPYGGQLIWTLPGQTKMYAHLKDKAKIRSKKRWSQVMYMYYLLGHRLMEREDLSPKRKDMIADNTYLLALDGDIDFQPDAVHLLVDLMKKNKALGAACGRIHPMGSGPMVWYQMFEYAVGHWLQKATEHMIGCVLCSPGCFSLFRAKALMDQNVMARYTATSKEAIHFVQYDQGEDRWLCTLLLQRGFRVEYSAASDAFTHCPEGFNEFYNQRRRWMPSTTANIFDLLMDYKRTVKINDSISRLYILYQIVLMVGTVLGPGTIFLMLVGAFVAAFQMDQWSSFVWNAVPILLFMIICILFDSKIQLLFAGIISAIYGLVMMAVLVGVMLQISQDGVMAPSSLFFFCVAGEMIIAAILHPKEINCLIYGIVYYVTVPSMYMLLVIYSVFNLNNVSWGTREVTIVSKPPEPKEPTENVKKDVKVKDKIFAFFGSGNDKDNAGSFEFSIAGLAKFMFCTHRKKSDEESQLLLMNETLKEMSNEVKQLRRRIDDPDGTDNDSIHHQHHPQTTVLEGSKGTDIGLYPATDSSYESKSQISDDLEPEPKNWLDEKYVGHGEIDFIANREKTFWVGVLNQYLFPYQDDKEVVAAKLKDLRDKSVMAFFMLNALFVLIVFLLTLKKDLLHVKWPLNVKVNFTYKEDVTEIQMYKTYLELEPIGFVFLIFFASLLVVQFTAMLFHRFGTLSQILSTTYINWDFYKTLDKKNLTEEQILQNDPVNVVKKLCKIKGAEDGDDYDEEKVELAPGRRKTVKNLAESKHREPSVTNLFEAFDRRTSTKFIKNSKDNQGRKSMAAFVNNRRSTVHYNRAARNVHFSTPPKYQPKKSFVNEGFAVNEEDEMRAS